MSKAEKDVLAERQRQIDVEGWTPEHDDEHTEGEMEKAAMCYMLWKEGDDVRMCGRPKGWPWSLDWWKPKGRRRNLIRAAALRLAEKQRIERMLKEATEMFEIAVNLIERLDRVES